MFLVVFPCLFVKSSISLAVVLQNWALCYCVLFLGASHLTRQLPDYLQILPNQGSNKTFFWLPSKIAPSLNLPLLATISYFVGYVLIYLQFRITLAGQAIYDWLGQLRWIKKNIVIPTTSFTLITPAYFVYWEHTTEFQVVIADGWPSRILHKT